MFYMQELMFVKGVPTLTTLAEKDNNLNYR